MTARFARTLSRSRLTLPDLGDWLRPVSYGTLRRKVELWESGTTLVIGGGDFVLLPGMVIRLIEKFLMGVGLCG